MTKPREQILREKISKYVVRTVKEYNELVSHGCEEIARMELFKVIDVLFECEIKIWIMYDEEKRFYDGIPLIKIVKIYWPLQLHPDTVFQYDGNDQNGS